MNSKEKIVQGINELIEELNKMIAKHKELEVKKADYEKQLSDIINNNIKTLFYPRFFELIKLDEALHKETGESGFATEKDGFSYLPLYGYPTAKHYGAYINHNAIKADYYENDYNIKYFEKYFLTEDLTLATLAKFEEVFKEHFEKYKDILQRQNTNLSTLVDELLKALNNSHAVETKADGSIEITLGGKTYIGTVKEV